MQDFLRMTFEEPWTVPGLISGLIAASLISATLHATHGNGAISVGILATLFTCWITAWVRKNRIGKTKRDSIGIVLCVHVADKVLWRKLQEDFINPLAKELRGQNHNRFFDILALPPHITNRYRTVDEAAPLLPKTRARGLIYGFVRKRGARYTIDLNCLVRHKKLPEQSTNRFQKEISGAWIHRFNLENQEHRIELFELSSGIISICARYILALSLYASQDLENAEVIFSSLKIQLQGTKDADLTQIRQIRKNITNYLNSIYLQRAQHCLRIWHETSDLTNIEIMEKTLAKVYGFYQRNGHYLTLSSIAGIVLRGDFRLAKSNLMKIHKRHRNVLWHLNIAFVYAGENNEAEVVRNYEIAKSKVDSGPLEVDLNLLADLEEFIERYRAQVKDSALFCFMLAYLNGHFKGDEIKAAADLLAFQQHPAASQYPKATKALTP